jgi:CspA family cold shock protein
LKGERTHLASKSGSYVEDPRSMQGVVKSYDPTTGTGVIVRDTNLSEYDVAADALAGSIFRMLRQGQRVVFDLDDTGCATRLRLGSEADMASPAEPPPV